MLIRFFFFNLKIVEMMKIFLLIAALVACVSAANSKCGENCLYTKGGCPDCPCGTKANKVDIAPLCKKYSWDQKCCQCIATAESKGNANAVNYNADSKTYDVGLWQINSRNWAQCSGGKAPCDPQANLDCAIKVYNWGGKKWGGANGRLWATAKQCGCTTTG